MHSVANRSDDATASAAKRVLVVVYTQTGQLETVARRVIEPLQEAAAIQVTVLNLKPVTDFPYPWPILRFFDAFPESALQLPGPLQSLAIDPAADFDLVILCYQVWFLAPSQPIVAFLQHPQARRLLAGKPVITVVACRNMWMMAHTRMAALLRNVGARHLDNVVLTDTASTLATLITTPLWLLTGRKQPVPGLPPAGVSEQEIRRCARFGRALRDALFENRERGDLPLLTGLGAVNARPELMISEKAGTRSFFVWGHLLRRVGPPGALLRLPLLTIYIAFLVLVIVSVVPLSLTLQYLLRPLLRRRLESVKQAFERPSGSGVERLPLYDQ